MDSTNLPTVDAAETTAQTTPADLVLLIFIHGFKGTDTTFGEFPERLQHVLAQGLENTTVESIIFPVYETKGELNAAVVRFADWLTDLTVRREVATGGAGRAKIVLCGHSMGGLLAADALLEFVQTRPDKQAPLWPNIVACVAFDTPYLGLHPHVFKNSATQAAQYVRTANNVLNSFKTWRSKTPSGAAAAAAAAADVPPPVPSKAAIDAPPTPESPTMGSLWQKYAAPAAYTIGGALFAGAAAGAAYYKREDIGVGYAWVTDHLKYVGNLWNRDELEERLDKLLYTESTMGVLFQTFYTALPPSPPEFPNERTFAIIPSRRTPLGTHFAANVNTIAADEVQAHIGMFDGKTNDGYYDLGILAGRLIREAVLAHQAHGSVAAKNAPPAQQVKEAVHSSETAQQADAIAQTAAAMTPAVPAVAAVPQPDLAPTTPAVVAQAAPQPVIGDDEESDDEEDEEDDDEEDDEEEEEEEVAVEKAPAGQPSKPAKPTVDEDEDEDDDEDDEDEDDDDDDDDEDEDDDDEDDEDEEETAGAPAKKT